MCLTARRPWQTSDARDSPRGAGSSPPPPRRVAHRNSARRIRGDRGAEARELLSVLPAIVSGDEGVSDSDGGASASAGPGVASLGNFLGPELQLLAGTSPEAIPESDERAPSHIQAPPPTPLFVFASEDFPSLSSGGSGRNLASDSAPPASFLLVGEVPIWVAATGVPPLPELGQGRG
jgi:hypothetical protein